MISLSLSLIDLKLTFCGRSTRPEHKHLLHEFIPFAALYFKESFLVLRLTFSKRVQEKII